jgi:hypothetical protein
MQLPAARHGSINFKRRLDGESSKRIVTTKWGRVTGGDDSMEQTTTTGRWFNTDSTHRQTSQPEELWRNN